MAILSKPQSKSGHWYDVNGNPFHTMTTADGSGTRATTIKDAKRLGLIPSVTSILQVLAKPGLESWKLDQVVLACLKNAKQPDEGVDYYCRRVRDAAFEQVEDAADVGSDIHAALDLATDGQEYDNKDVIVNGVPVSLSVFVEPVVSWINASGLTIVEREIQLVNKAEGFAGTSDVFFRYGKNGIGILDYKTKKTVPGKAVGAYDENAMQLAAYAATYYGPEALGSVQAANIVVSRTEPGRVDVVKHKDLSGAWETFKHAAAIWRFVKGYDPRVALAAA
jgi:hypothetical protein